MNVNETNEPDEGNLLDALDGMTEVADYLEGVRTVFTNRGYSEAAVEQMVVQAHQMAMQQIVIGAAERSAEKLQRQAAVPDSLFLRMLGRG